VLIDEVDMHLHPGWQQTVLTDLSAAFPKLQFVVTTHSPQVLSSIRRDSIRVLGQDVDGAAIAEPPLAMTYGEPSGDVLQSVMSIDPLPPVSERADLQRLTELVDQGNYNAPQAAQLMSSLVAALGSQHPQLQRLQRSMQRQEALKR
jgi:predicted ATP-binding protein involved in virulence